MHSLQRDDHVNYDCNNSCQGGYFSVTVVIVRKFLCRNVTLHSLLGWQLATQLVLPILSFVRWIAQSL